MLKGAITISTPQYGDGREKVAISITDKAMEFIEQNVHRPVYRAFSNRQRHWQILQVHVFGCRLC